MEKENYIDLTTICRNHNVSDVFILALYEYRLIEIQEIDNTKFVSVNQLKELEKFVRLHNELNINLEGIDAIYHLMQRIQSMEHEMNILRQRLRIYEDGK
ncbi:MAG: chaperone modulator CbpM [Flavobacterium sp.]